MSVRDHDEAGFRQRPAWIIMLTLILVAQGLLGWGWLNPDPSWRAAPSPLPIVEGQHALHYYHAKLGVETFRRAFSLNCYDPHYQAGIPKTPVFDAGSRPFELSFLLQQRSEATAYRYTLLAVIILIPLLFALASRGFLYTAGTSVLFALVGVAFSWIPQYQQFLHNGEIAEVLSLLFVLTFLGGMHRYSVSPGVTSWFMLVGSGTLGLFCQPMVWVPIVPLAAIVYVAVAPRHGLAWQLGWCGGLILAVMANIWWLVDWLNFLWLKRSTADRLAPLPNLDQFLGHPEDYLKYLNHSQELTVALALAGLALFTQLLQRRFLSLFILLLTVFLLVSVMRLLETWSTADLILDKQVFLLVPVLASLCFVGLLDLIHRRFPVLNVVVPLGVLGLWLQWSQELPVHRYYHWVAPKLTSGYSPEQLELQQILKNHTGKTARILLDEDDVHSCWQSLLALETDRFFIGGLTNASELDHAVCSLCDQSIHLKALRDWRPEERSRYIQRYNLGWVVTKRPEMIAFWLTEPGAIIIHRSKLLDGWSVLAFDRPHSFVLQGQARIERMTTESVVLTDLVPNERGEIVLSLHHHPALKLAPDTLFMDKDPDMDDPIPFIKIWLQGPCSRATITWNHP